MTKRQKMLIATFFLGLISLGVDCLFLRPPEGAAAASADAAQQYAVPLARGDDPVPAPAEAQGQSVAQRLDRLWPQGQINAGDVRDPFALPTSWSVVRRMVGLPTRPLAAFARVTRSGGRGLDGRQVHALVGDRFPTPGQQIDGLLWFCHPAGRCL
jgi:hypothetical protein